MDSQQHPYPSYRQNSTAYSFNTFISLRNHIFISVYPVNMSTQFTVYTSTYYVCITIDNGNCELTISPWMDEIPTVFPATTSISDESLKTFMIHYDNDENWIDINFDIYDNDEYFSHASLHWSACMVLDCPDHPTYTKSYQAHTLPLRRTCSFCYDDGHSSSSCDDLDDDSFLDDIEEAAYYNTCGYCGKKGHRHIDCLKKSAREYMQQWVA